MELLENTDFLEMAEVDNMAMKYYLKYKAGDLSYEKALLELASEALYFMRKLEEERSLQLCNSKV